MPRSFLPDRFGAAPPSRTLAANSRTNGSPGALEQLNAAFDTDANHEAIADAQTRVGPHAASTRRGTPDRESHARKRRTLAKNATVAGFWLV